MRYNENIKRFDELLHHLEFKTKRLETTKAHVNPLPSHAFAIEGRST